MPKVAVIDGFHLFFWANENNEPIHVHVRHSGRVCKYWVSEDEVELVEPDGFKDHELGRIEKIVHGQRAAIIKKWKKVFRGGEENVEGD